MAWEKVAVETLESIPDNHRRFCPDCHRFMGLRYVGHILAWKCSFCGRWNQELNPDHKAGETPKS